MDGAGAKSVIDLLSAPEPIGLDDIWIDPRRVATTTWQTELWI
jgi:hypothetical protein